MYVWEALSNAMIAIKIVTVSQFLNTKISYNFIYSYHHQIGFSASDAITSLKLIEAGVPKEKFAIMAVPLVPLQIILPLFLSKYTVGARPMDLYIRAIPYR